MSNKTRLKIVTFILIVATIIFTPLLIAKLVIVEKFVWMTADNDWIGFWGGYLGGVLTLLGVFITIQFTQASENNKQKLLLRPYFIFKEMGKDHDATERIVVKQILENENSSNPSIVLNTLHVFGYLKNVGLGCAIQCRLTGFALENKHLNLSSNTLGGIQPDTTFFIYLQAEHVLVEKVRYLNNCLNLIKG